MARNRQNLCNFDHLHFFQQLTLHLTGLLSCNWSKGVDGGNFVVRLYACGTEEI